MRSNSRALEIRRSIRLLLNEFTVDGGFAVEADIRCDVINTD